MLEFDIRNMNCGHCVRAVTEAVQEADPDARVEVDLPAKHMRVETSAAREQLVKALADAGYPPA